MDQVIKDYLHRNGGGTILNEYKNTKQIGEQKRKLFVNLLVDFIVARYGLYPSTEVKKTVAMAAIKLFPCFEISSSKAGGMVSFIHCYVIAYSHNIHMCDYCHFLLNIWFEKELFYNGSDNNSPGWIITTLKTRRKEVTKQKVNEVENIDSDCETEENEEREVAILRSLLVNEENMLIIKQKLAKTIKLRSRLVNDDNVNLLERFPYFYTCPELVNWNLLIQYLSFNLIYFFQFQILYDFSLMYEDASDIFMEKWQNVKGSVEHVLKLHGADKDFSCVFGTEVEQLLMLLKLLPVKQCGRKTASKRSTFIESIDKIIIYKEVKRI